MRVIILFAIISLSSIFIIGCGDVDPQEIVGINNEPVLEESVYGTDAGVWAKDNFELQTIGNVLEESDDLEDFERRINRDERFNNLDLNGDGYADYISVREFDDRDDNQRGFTLFSRFDGNDIQEIASIIFDRDRPDRYGSRVYVRGNEQIYGDNFYYGGNWLDKSLDIARYLFSDRDDYYRSPYYVDNYPTYYDEYRVVETPVYRDRITKYMVNPAMTKITTPTQKIMIKSPYPGRSYNRVYAKMAKPTKDQIKFYKEKPDKPNFSKRNTVGIDRRDRDDRASEKFDKKDKGFETNNGAKNDLKRNKGIDKPLPKGNDPKNNGRKINSSPPKSKPPKQVNKPAKAPKNNGAKSKGGNKGNGKGKGKGKN